MIISLNWLKKYVDIDLEPAALVDLIGTRLVEVEGVQPLGEKYQDVVAAQVILAQKMEGSDHLWQVLIDDGDTVDGVERDSDGYVQVVCGAPNLKSGMMVAWLPPGATIPATFDNPNPIILDSRKLMGVKSHGMIASAEELDLYDEHDGILELDQAIKPGTYLKDVFELDDYLLDIENKSLTNRPDTFGLIGFAREVAGIQHKPFKTPAWLLQPLAPKSLKFGESLNVVPTVAIDSAEAASNYQLIVVDGNFTAAKTPQGIQSYLARVGVRPVNPIVDATNYMMLLTGQPLHAFDYDKLVEVAGGVPEMKVRFARPGEILETIDGRTLTLTEEDVVVAANDHVVALAGAIGGKETAVDETTKSVALESATFNLYKLRGTQMRHGVFSEAITRFTKGQPVNQAAPVLLATIALMDEWGDVSTVSELSHTQPAVPVNEPIELDLVELNQVLSSQLDVATVKQLLQNTEFTVKDRGDRLIVSAPWWRPDIKIKEDLIEEVGRLRGYDNIETSLPLRSFKPVSRDQFSLFKQQIRQVLQAAGENEVLSYSFVPRKLLDWAHQDFANAYKIVNSISPELEYYRLSIMPSLLKIARMNLKQGYDNFGLFELNKVHALSRGITDDAVPKEGYNLANIIYNKHGSGGAPYYQAKYILEYLMKNLNIELAYMPLDLKENNQSMFAPYEEKRSAMLKHKQTGALVGVVGEFKKAVLKNFKLPEGVAGFQLDLIKLFDIYNTTSKVTYQPISKYPKVQRDFCFQVPKNLSHQKIYDVIINQLAQEEDSLDSRVETLDIYAEKGKESKNVTFRVVLQPHHHTLAEEDIKRISDSLKRAAHEKVGAVAI